MKQVNGFLVARLLAVLSDKDEGTPVVIARLIERNKLPDAAIVRAIDAASGPGVNSPTRVAVAELKKWGR